MHTVKLRTVGGSTMVAIPPSILEALRLAPKSEVSMSIEGDRLVIAPKVKRKGRIGLEARLAMCDFSIPMSNEEREWLDAPLVGREKI